jgi:hypothetical protein
MSTTLLDRLVDPGLESASSPLGILERIRVTGRIPLTTRVRIDTGEYEDQGIRMVDVVGQLG